MHPRVTLTVVVLICVAFNALWLSRSSMDESAWWQSVVAANVAFALLAGVHFANVRQLRRRASSLERSVQRLELRAGDQERETLVLETISSVSAAFLNEVHVHTLLRQMSEAIHQILQVDISVIEMLPRPDIMETTTFQGGAQAVELGSELRQRVIEEGKSILLNDLSQFPRYASLHSQALRSVIAAPFRQANRVIGLVGAFSTSDRRFTSRDLGVLQRFATHTSLLLESAALLEAVKRVSLRRGADEVDTLDALRSRLSFQRERADREFSVAQRIQSELLPRSFPALRNTTIDAVAVPAREVGGDFFDVIPLGDGLVGVAVADVAGKGVPASLVMVMAHTLLRAAVDTAHSPRDVLIRLNTELFEQTTGDCFVSMFFGIWDDATRTLRYANAGHEPPVLVRPGASVLLKRGGIALGAVNELENYIVEEAVALGPQDALVLYTDGVREAMDAESHMYGIDRLVTAAEHAVAARDRLIAALQGDIGRFVSDAEQHDDITLLTLQSRGEGQT
jgi:serine phosphatase RsbU (regulator of sigma subunit)/putative methionine-R-sulfoxide reductase with GAF domain